MNLLIIILAMMGDSAIAIGPQGACHGTVVAPGTIVLESCSLASLADAAVYYESSDEPLAGFLARPGAKPGRVIVTFTKEQMQ